MPVDTNYSDQAYSPRKAACLGESETEDMDWPMARIRSLLVALHSLKIFAPCVTHAPWKASSTVTPYRLNEADLQIPNSWQDQSINIFKLPAVGGAKEASFVISRDPSQGDLPFAEYISRQIENAEKQLPGFKLILRGDFLLHGHAASRLDYSWQREGRELMLRQVFVERKPAVLITTLTTTPDDLVHHEPAWKLAMQTLKPLPPAA